MALREEHLRVLSVIALGVLATIWGTQFLVIKSGQATLPPLFAAAARFSLVALISQCVVTLRGMRAPSGHARARVLFGVAQAVSMGTLYWAEQHMPSFVAALLCATEPFLVAALAHRLVAGERFTLRSLVALSLGFVGFALIAFDTSNVSSGHNTELLAVVSILVGCIAGATNKIVGKRLSLGLPAPVAMRDMGLTVAVVLGTGSLLFERNLPFEASPRTLLTLVYLAAIASTAASTTYFMLLRRFPVTVLAYLQFATALVATLTGVVIGRERFSIAVGSGVVGILAGLVVLASGTRVSARRELEQEARGERGVE